MNYTRPDATYPAIAESGTHAALSPSEISAGWSTTSQSRPPADEFNARDFYTSSAMKYLCRLGVAEYSPAESYQGLGLCIGSNGSVYWNLVACMGINPVTDATGHWEKTAIRRADCAELIGNVTGGTIPETTNLLKGNGTGSAADSGISDDGVNTSFPTNMMVNGGFCLYGSGAVNNGTMRLSFGADTSFLDAIATGGARGQITLRIGAAGGANLIEGLRIDANGNSIFGGYITASAGAIAIGNRTYAPSVPRVVSDNESLFLNAANSGNILANWDYAGNFIFGNGQQQVMAQVDSIGTGLFGNLPATPNCGVRIGQRQGQTSLWVTGSPNINADNANLVINSATSTGGVYFNWDQGGGGVIFGNGAGAGTANISAAGNFQANGTITALGRINGQTFRMPCATNDFLIYTDGATSFLDGGDNYRLYLNYGAGGGENGLVFVCGVLATTGQIQTPWWKLSAPGMGNVQGSRAFNTQYQNTTGMSLQVSMTATTTGGSTGILYVYIGQNSGSLSGVYANENTASVNGAETGVLFMVPPNWFYQVGSAGDITGIGRWWEWTCP
jgi:hypothetical protein